MEKLTMKSLNERIEKLEAQVAELSEKLSELKPRDRGPKSTRQMTDEDATRVIWGDLKELSHKEAAKELGLSYNQIYSARGEFTFKHLWKEYFENKK